MKLTEPSVKNRKVTNLGPELLCTIATVKLLLENLWARPLEVLLDYRTLDHIPAANRWSGQIPGLIASVCSSSNRHDAACLGWAALGPQLAPIDWPLAWANVGFSLDNNNFNI